MGLLLCKQILYHLSHQVEVIHSLRVEAFFLDWNFVKLRIEEGEEGLKESLTIFLGTYTVPVTEVTIGERK